jgi:hypothetical protein
MTTVTKAQSYPYPPWCAVEKSALQEKPPFSNGYMATHNLFIARSNVFEAASVTVGKVICILAK